MGLGQMLSKAQISECFRRPKYPAVHWLRAVISSGQPLAQGRHWLKEASGSLGAVGDDVAVETDAKPAGGLAGALRADPVTTWQRRTDGRFRQGMIILAETTEIEETGAARR